MALPIQSILLTFGSAGMKIKRVMIAAPKSGSGKTVVTCALLQVLKDCGLKVASYKCGPDYIDPMFHEKIIDVPAKNLDTFFTDEEKTRKLFQKSVMKMDFSILTAFTTTLMSGFICRSDTSISFNLPPLPPINACVAIGSSVNPSGALDGREAYAVRVYGIEGGRVIYMFC